jgi:hypothetical protein
MSPRSDSETPFARLRVGLRTVESLEPAYPAGPGPNRDHYPSCCRWPRPPPTDHSCWRRSSTIGPASPPVALPGRRVHGRSESGELRRWRPIYPSRVHGWAPAETLPVGGHRAASS